MMILIMTTTISFILPMTVMLIATTFSKKSINDREKSSPFECGFDPKSSARMPFSIQFFLIAVIFLIFDVEIALILPIVIIMKSSDITTPTMQTSILPRVPLMEPQHEWEQGVLSWAD
uniref:NADH-ubiquinone oxidoreductase chain 3 n=1 Tax=Trilophidia annulata TaxID=215063 RepID=A0A0F7J1Q2_9ORTH|nr:NADH dehydrogenase subunit 3 [Trilophidia annulata]AKH04355.1 NADH dehydrogenase subunit 3 [Trilophidia annulata]